MEDPLIMFRGTQPVTLRDEDQQYINTGNPLPVTGNMSIVDSNGNEALVNDDGQLHIVAEGHLCGDNSTTTPLLADGIWTGTAKDILAYNAISVFITSDVASAVGGLEIQYSADGSTNWRTAESYTLLAGSEKWFTPPAFGKFFRVKFTNGGSDQTSFELTTMMRKVPIKWSSHNIEDPITDEDDATLTKAVITGKKANGDFDNASLTNGGNFKVSLEEIESGISTNSNTQLKTTLYDEGGVPAEIDNSTHSLQTIDYAHHEVHSGSHYYAQGVLDLSINQVLDFTWLMPNTTKWIHWTWKLQTESETAWYVYENAVATNPLANTFTPCNNNRNSANTSGTVLKYEIQTNLAGANADTDVTGATLLSSGIAGSGRDAGEARRENEVILKQNTLYCLRTVASTAGYINFDMDWYEHQDKN